MTVVLDGHSLGIDAVVRVARGRERVELTDEALVRIRAAREVVERAVERGDEVYGLSTGVGARKRFTVGPDDLAEFNRALVVNHRTGTGPDAPEDVVRATMLALANSFALGCSGVRAELAELVVSRLNDGRLPRVRMLGSIGVSDLAPMADLAWGLLDGEAPAPKEGLSLLNNGAFSTGLAALAVADARRLVRTIDVAGALDLEAFAANLSPLHPDVARVRPCQGLPETLERLRGLLAGSALWDAGAARNLQDPLSFRCLPQIQGAALFALGHIEAHVETELNASQENPLVLPDEDRIVSVGNFDLLPLAAALDYLRIALASVLTSANERMLKLLLHPLTGLPEGLAPERGAPEDSLGEFGVTGQALVAEARLLAQPVSFELASTSHAEGIEDRTTMAPLAARRLAEMVDLGERAVAIELVVGAQAVDLRGAERLGAGAATAHAAVRERIPFSGPGEPIPVDLEPLRLAIRESRFAEIG